MVLCADVGRCSYNIKPCDRQSLTVRLSSRFFLLSLASLDGLRFLSLRSCPAYLLYRLETHGYGEGKKHVRFSWVQADIVLRDYGLFGWAAPFTESSVFYTNPTNTQRLWCLWCMACLKKEGYAHVYAWINFLCDPRQHPLCMMIWVDMRSS